MIYMNTGPTLQLQWNTISLPHWPSKDRTELTNSSMSWLKTNGFKQSNQSMNWTEFGCLIDFLKFPAKRKTRTTWKWKMTSGWTRLKKLNKNNIEDIQSWYWFWSRTHSEEINCGGFSCGSRLDLAQHRGILHNVRLLKIRSCSIRWGSSKKENLTLLFKTKSPWAANLGFWVKKEIQISVEMRMWLLWIFDATSLVFWLLVRLNPR